MKNIAFAFVTTILLIVSISFAIPGVPHQFYGNVTINGVTAPDGTSVTATINNAPAGSTTASSGTYNLLVEDPNNVNSGETVLLFVNGVQAGTAVFANGASTELNLAVTITTTTSPDGSPSGGSSGGSTGGGGGGSSSGGVGSSASIPTPGQTGENRCVETWLCSNWSPCDGGLQTRSCTDLNKCGTNIYEPLTSQPCSMVGEDTVGTEQPINPPIPPITAFLIGATKDPLFVAVIIILILAAAFIVLKNRKTIKSRYKFKPKKR